MSSKSKRLPVRGALDAVLDFAKTEVVGKQVRIPYKGVDAFLRINCNATDGGTIQRDIGQPIAETMAEIIYQGLKE